MGLTNIQPNQHGRAFIAMRSGGGYQYAGAVRIDTLGKASSLSGPRQNRLKVTAPVAWTGQMTVRTWQDSPLGIYLGAEPVAGDRFDLLICYGGNCSMVDPGDFAHCIIIEDAVISSDQMGMLTTLQSGERNIIDRTIAFSADSVMRIDAPDQLPVLSPYPAGAVAALAVGEDGIIYALCVYANELATADVVDLHWRVAGAWRHQQVGEFTTAADLAAYRLVALRNRLVVTTADGIHTCRRPLDTDTGVGDLFDASPTNTATAVPIALFGDTVEYAVAIFADGTSWKISDAGIVTTFAAAIDVGTGAVAACSNGVIAVCDGSATHIIDDYGRHRIGVLPAGTSPSQLAVANGGADLMAAVGAKLYSTHDYAASWDELCDLGAEITRLERRTATVLYVILSGGVPYVSVSGGEHWSRLQTGGFPALYAIAEAGSGVLFGGQRSTGPEVGRIAEGIVYALLGTKQAIAHL